MMPPHEHEHSTGARPAGIADDAQVPAAVRQMFNEIAPRYDLLNHLLSLGLDRLWWNKAARTFAATLAKPEATAVDLCCGTGDMTLALDALRPRQEPGTPPPTDPGAPPSPTASSSAKVGSQDSPAPTEIAPILAIDFSREMLNRADRKFLGHNIRTIEADALHLPLPDNSVDLVTSAFGFRNLASYEAGLAEIHRVLRPGGHIGILECNQPGGLSGALYSLYFKRILPLVGGLLSGSRSAYAYLPASVERFPRPPRMIEMLRAANFTDPQWHAYTLKAAGLYVAQKPF